MELTPEEMLLAALLRRAIKDAQACSGTQERVREEASRWLWTVAPSIAERAGVTKRIAADKVSLSAAITRRK